MTKVGIARAAQALAPRVALAIIKYSITAISLKDGDTFVGAASSRD